jgi:class 3 adenylate cyclase
VEPLDVPVAYPKPLVHATTEASLAPRRPSSSRRPSRLLGDEQSTPVLTSLERLAAHVPSTVLRHLEECEARGDGIPKPPYKVPMGKGAPTPLLFIDISGFTKMSTVLPVNDLSIVINGYFSAILKIIASFGGDVLKFAGDAVFAVFADQEKNATKTDSDSSPAVSQLLMAALCSDVIVQTLSDYSPPQYPHLTTMLNVHCGVAYDFCELAVVSTSHDSNSNHPASFLGQRGRSELLLWGPVIDAVAEAEVKAELGEVHCCAKTQTELGLVGSLLAKVGQPCAAQISPAVAEAVEHLKGNVSLRFKSVKFAMDQISKLLRPPARFSLQAALCPFAHAVAAKKEEGAPRERRSSLHSNAVTELLSDAELRPVFTVFAMVEGIDWADSDAALQTLQSIMDLACDICRVHSGALRQFIVDDKGVVLIFNFGLPGFIVQHQAERVLEFADSLAKALQIIALKARIGVTVGDAYCGLVGGVSRHEYAIMGPTVNLSARLMCTPCPVGAPYNIVIDENVREQAESFNTGFSFYPMEAIEAKGFDKLVHIFRPTRKAEGGSRPGSAASSTGAATAGRRSSVGFVGRIRTEAGGKKLGFAREAFVGREQNVSDLLSIAEIALTPTATSSSVVALDGEGGVGKTALARKVAVSLKTNSPALDVFYGYCDTTGGSAPLVAFRKVFRSLLSSLKVRQESQLAALATTRNFKNDKFTNEQLVSATMEIFGITSMSTPKNKTTEKEPSPAVPIMDLRQFIVCIFGARANRGACIIIDDAHHIDHESLLLLGDVVRDIPNVFVITTTREVTSEFTEAVEGAKTLTIAPMEKDELFALINATFDDNKTPVSNICRERRHADAFLNELHNLSGGVPLFAVEVVKLAMKNKLLVRSRTESGEIEGISWKSNDTESDSAKDELLAKITKFGSVSELVLSKFDELSIDLKDFAGKCAILGAAFDADDLFVFGFTKEEIGDGLYDLEEQDVMHEEEADSRDVDDDDDDILDEGGGGVWRWRQQIWYSTVYKLMLSPTRIALHAEIACKLEGDSIKTLTKKHHHWLQARNAKEACEVGLKVADWFSKRALLASAYKVLTQSLELAIDVADDAKDNASALPLLIKVQIEKAKCLASMANKRGSAESYQLALSMFENAEEGAIEDKSIVFPVISGILLALKWGAIEDDEDASYERELVRKFVESARAHGDLGHVSRAIALKGVMLQRLGKWTEAVASQEELEMVYTTELSEGICKAYGSDRGAQSYPLAAQWLYITEGWKRSEKVEEQVAKSVELIESKEMEERNVHNKFMLVYPLVCLNLEGGKEEAGAALDLWEAHILAPFAKHYSADAKVFFKTAYQPVFWLLAIKAGRETEKEKTAAGEYLRECARGSQVVGGSALLDTVMVLLGRGFSSLAAELGMAWLREREKEAGASVPVNEEVQAWAAKLLQECSTTAASQAGLAWEARACSRVLKSAGSGREA